MRKSGRFKIVLAASLLVLAVLVGTAGTKFLLEKKTGTGTDSVRQEQQRLEDNGQAEPGDSREADKKDFKTATESEAEEPKTEEELEKNRTQTEEEMLQGKIDAKLDSMSLEEKAAQLFIITPEALTGRSAVTKAGEATRAVITEYPVGGLVYFEGNIQSEPQIIEMLERQQEYSRERIGLPLFTTIDEEGGQVVRLASCPQINVQSFEDLAQIGASLDASRALEVGEAIGEYLNRMGFNLDYAPVADVLTNPDNTVVKRRSYGSDPQVVSEMVIKNLEGLKKHQVYGCVKHFPGHGSTLGDTHAGYAYTDKVWEELKESELVPFADSIAWGTEFVMVGHISLPQVTGSQVPASLSYHVITGLLRGELGYDGIVLTDGLNMKAIADEYTSAQAAVNAVLAGNDMLLMPQDFKSAYEGVLAAVREGILTEERLDESLKRILKVKLQM